MSSAGEMLARWAAMIEHARGYLTTQGRRCYALRVGPDVMEALETWKAENPHLVSPIPAMLGHMPTMAGIPYRPMQAAGFALMHEQWGGFGKR